MATASSSKPASSMAELMATYTSPFVALKRGEDVKGKITKINKSEIRADINAKAEAIVLEKDHGLLQNLLTQINVGDELTFTVLTPENENGQPVVSLRRFIENRTWDGLTETQKNQEQLTVTVTDVTKGGYLVTTETGTSGFLPNSHVSFMQQEKVQPGQKIKVSVLELNRKENKMLFSQKSTITGEEFKKLANKLPVGQKLTGVITHVASFGLFISLSEATLEGFVHISEVSWEKVEDLTDLYTVGQEIEAVVIRHDMEGKRIDLSVKRLTEDPFGEVMKQYPVEKKVSGKVTGQDNNGVHLDLGEGVSALIKKEKVPAGTTYTTGQEISVTVSEHDAKRHRLLVTPVLLEKPLMYR
ncbi:hypothetical protein BH11PAT1_BH11PAT1_4300 [soil metagenome]